MAKNIRFKRLGLVVVLVIGLSFLYVWQRIKIFRIGYEIRNTEKRLVKLREANALLQLKISSLTNPRHIKQQVENQDMDLAPPQERQIVRVH